MYEKKEGISEGDLVTVALKPHQAVSNTYVVARKLEAECLLSHHLAPDAYILKADSDVNTTFPSMQNPLEKCLVYAKRHRECLGYSMAADLDALCYFFVIKKEISAKQRHDIANLCGKIASVVLSNSLASAITTIKQNTVLLDEYSYSLLNNVKKILQDPTSIKTKGERYSIFNIAGFILAQLS